MESTGVIGRIQVPDDVHDRLTDDFIFEPRGNVEVKGKGVMRTWYLVAQREPAASDEAPAEERGAAVP
jgi:adenylate cyclase